MKKFKIAAKKFSQIRFYFYICNHKGQGKLTSQSMLRILVSRLPFLLKSDMDRISLQKVALRQRAVFIPENQAVETKEISNFAADFCINLYKAGYVVGERLLHVVNSLPETQLVEIYDVIKSALGIDKNWTPLVKNWTVPTGESQADHIATAIVNFFGPQNLGVKAVQMPCGHYIPEGSFPIERYNGCPFCGTPFEFSDEKFSGQGSKHKVLNLWTEKDLKHHFENLLASPVALDATQQDSLKILLDNFEMPSDAKIVVKETVVFIVDYLIKKGEIQKTAEFFNSPADILRYLWYKHTGQIQIIEPKTLIENKKNSVGYKWVEGIRALEEKALAQEVKKLKLHYSRPMCKIVAFWLDSLKLSAEKVCEIMHPKREMWVRFVRALRLAEFAKKDGYENLKRILDVFYRKDYTVWQGEVNKLRQSSDVDDRLKMLTQLQYRPGSFARQLFSLMLESEDRDLVLNKFLQIADQIPMRLLVTLGMYAENYFARDSIRTVKAITGKNKRIEKPRLLEKYSDDELKKMIQEVNGLYVSALRNRFSKLPTDGKTMYIAPELYDIPLSIGERATAIQDTDCALQGTVFKPEGNNIRLFLQWGVGLPAQHLDMDLSAVIIYKSGTTRQCAYYDLSFDGAKHSGDIQRISDKIGTAEYIELDIERLRQTDVKYAVFTCNAYTSGTLSPNLVVGWMDSKFPMKVSNKTGVAYDPSCVQHQVRISEINLSKGLVFGVLDIDKDEILWLEMPFGGQIAYQLDYKAVEGLIQKLAARTKIGDLLALKAAAQNIEIVADKTTADLVYDYNWALDSAKVSGLLLG